jgi:predicted porin
MERKLIAVAVATAMGLPMAADAVEGSASGHVNAAIVKVDDGDATLGSGNGSETRFRFTGSEELDSGMTAGVTLELGAGGATGYGGDTNGTRIRHANVSLSSAAGKVTIGQQGTATSGSSFADVGSTWIAGATNWCSYGIGSGAACVNNETGRKRAVRYDAPAIGPLSIGVAFGNDDVWDVAAQLSGSAGDANYNLRVGYNGETGNEDLIVGGSVTVGSTGVAASWTDGEDGNGDNESLYIKLDQSYGDGTVAVYYKRGENSTGEGDLWGVGLAHGLGGGATAYAGYRIVDNDADADQTDGFLAGLRVTFN